MKNVTKPRRPCHSKHRQWARTPIAVALAVAASSTHAFQFNTSEDWAVRWDNTFKYNLASRTNHASKEVVRDQGGTSLLADDPDLNFDRSGGGIISNRFDLLSELDLVWKDKLGFRITGAGWYDFAYDDSDHPGANPALGGANAWGLTSVKPGEFSDDAEDLHFRGGELLDAFAFWNWTANDVSGNLRAGRHTIFWGNSLLLTGAVHGVAGSMVAIDIAKGFAVPGSEAQELFLPTSKLSTVVQLTPNLTLNAYYSLEWQEYRLPETGSFFSPAEILTDDSEFFMLAPGAGQPGAAGFVPRVGMGKVSDEHPDDAGEWGVNVQYYFNNWDFEASFFYLNYSDKLPQGLTGALNLGPATAVLGGAGVAPFDALLPNLPPLVAAGLIDPNPDALAADALGIGQFKWVYKDDIDLFGFALSKEIAGISAGFELVYRKDAALPPDLGAAVNRITGIPAPLVPTLAAAGEIDYNFAGADSGNYPGPVGDTFHVVINALGLLNSGPLWDGGSYVLELTASWLDQVTENEALLNTANTGIKEDKVATAIGFNFTPEYFQVFSGTDIKIPLSVSYGIKNDAPISLGGNEGLGNASIGVELSIDQVWTVTTKYNTFFGSVDNGLLGLLKDRDNVSFTVKRTF